MSATLPSLTVPDAAGARILATFNNDPKEYRQWLRQVLRERVERTELRAVDNEMNTKRLNITNSINADLPDTVTPDIPPIP